jgi:hypothetical protein
MKAQLIALALLALVASPMLAGEKTVPTGKGMELYSWKPQGKAWHFSLIVGVNNRKPVLDIADVEKYAVVGVPTLKEKLSKLPKGERVYWWNLAKEPLPKETEKELRDYCHKLQVEFEAVTPQNSQ